MPWDETSPTKASPARDLDIVIRDLKQQLRDRLDFEHAFYLDETGHLDVGEHKQGSARLGFGPVMSRPEVNPLNPGGIYIQTDSNPIGKLEYDNGFAWVPLGYLRSDDASDQNVFGKLVKRDAEGNFIATQITANVVGNLVGNVQGNVVGDVEGNVIGSCSGSSGSCTGNAASATNATNATTAVTTYHIEARTDDPALPANGRIWLRTDL